jgi:hypothetical protein
MCVFTVFPRQRALGAIVDLDSSGGHWMIELVKTANSINGDTEDASDEGVWLVVEVVKR